MRLLSKYPLLENEFYIGSKTYCIRELSTNDVEAIQDLCHSCVDYYRLVEGMPPEDNEGKNILFDLPPNKDLEDKIVFGVFDETEKLISLIDVIKDYKGIGEWIIGLFIIEPNSRALGLGSTVHKIIERWVKNCGGDRLRIGVIKENINGVNFWSSQRYTEVERLKMKFKNKEHTVIIMNLLI